MIRQLEGKITAISESSIVVMVNGIGYQVFTNTSRREFIPDETVFMYTHLAVRETALDLYGFTDRDELTYFELLLNIPKVGPKSALAILNQADINLLYSTAAEQDADQLHKLSGIGKKTAINIVNYLSSKLDQLPNTASATAVSSSQLSTAQIDAIDALITLGYDPKEARSYVIKMNGSDDTKTLVQEVLKQIPIP
ncbi:MAG: Holliday junction branch migration protein RuvA [Candidatus Nomurabacteria bacterium]|nr:Holliday junction branch migration protein RuvA [Candidatus Nomurabacteria bacterium]USN87297.1 MAG: Holliday junction branch migration protein RuvA [Candidatus Nomurabacteria bacterium]